MQHKVRWLAMAS